MAKSVSVLLLATLAIAVSLDAAHMVTAAPITFAGIAELAGHIGPEIKSLVKDHPGVFENPSELVEKIKDFGDLIKTVIETYNDAHGQRKTALPPKCYYFQLTTIEVDGQTLGGGSVILVSNTPFLNTQAYKQLKTELLKKGLTAVDATSQVGLDFQQLCYAEPADKLPEIILVPAGMRPVKNVWHKQSDGLSTCLDILS